MQNLHATICGFFVPSAFREFENVVGIFDKKIQGFFGGLGAGLLESFLARCYEKFAFKESTIFFGAFQ